QLVEIEHRDALQARDAVEVEVVGHDGPALALGRAYEVSVDLPVGRRLVLGDLKIDRRFLLHVGQHLQASPAATAPGNVRRVSDLLQLAQHGAQDHERHVDKAGLGDVQD